MSDCPKCNGSMRVLGGCSAHPDNWFCEDESGCGYQAWNKNTHISQPARAARVGLVSRVLFWLSGFLPTRLIYVDNAPYLERYFVARLFGLTVYLHRFISADGDRHLHDHPWRALALVLSGGYIEERLVAFDQTGPLVKINRRHRFRPTPLGMTSFHRIASMTPGTWTLFVHGARKKHWGFLEPHMASDNDRAVTCYQPFYTSDPQHTKGWEKRSPKGRHSDREPLFYITDYHAKGVSK